MTMKPLIIRLLLVVTVAMRMPLSVADPYTNIVSSHCGNISEYRNGSAFQSNLNKVLERLVQSVYYSASNTSSAGDEGSDSIVYGLVQCIGVIDPDDCRQCASTAKTTLVQGCNGTSGDIQLNGCLLRYDDYKFYSQSPELSTVWSNCGDTKYRNGSVFERNLNKLLESLVGNVIPSGFNTSSVVEKANSNSTVYGLVQCRGDLGSSACKQCASTAKAKLVEGCHNTSGTIQLEGCFLRYDNHNFYNNIQNKHGFIICDFANNSQPQEFTDTVRVLLSNVTTKAQQSPILVAADSVVHPFNLTGNIYSLAQCWRDLSPANCGSCLTLAFGDTSYCPSGTVGAQFGSENCYLRYEVYKFFHAFVRLPESKNGSNLSPSLPQQPQPGKGPPASNGKVLGITLGVIAAVLGLIATVGLWMWYFSSRLKRRDRISGTKEVILSRTIINPELIFKYDILREATCNFKMENKLGEGGFGCVFKRVLPNGREVAVKRLNLGSRQGDAEFLNEANLISRVQHRNLVKLFGCSVESSERLLVYEYLPNGSLDRLLFDTTKRHLLDWKERYEIIVGVAHGLAYLHQGSEIRIIHRDIKASNILLDHKHRPKIADFGLARLLAEDQSHVSTRVAGTFGYVAPEYALRGQLTEKADVFSFGVLLLEIISGRKNQGSAEDMDLLIEKTWRLYKAQRALEVIDPTLEGSYSWEEGIRVIKIGLLCTQAAAALRPSMSRVVWMLTSDGEHLLSPTKPAFIDVQSVDAPDLRPPDVHSAATAPSSSVYY